MNIFAQYKNLRRENYVLFFGRIVTSMGAMIWPMLTLLLSRKLGLNAGIIGILMALGTVCMFPANILGGRIADKYEKKMNIVRCDLVSVTAYIICALIPLSMISVVLMFIAAFCQTMEQPSYSALIADLTETKDRERAYSLSYLGGNLGFVLSPTIAGILLENHLPLCYLISGLSIGCSTALIFFLIGKIVPVREESEEASYQVDRGNESIFTIMKENPAVMLFILTMGLYFGVYVHTNYLMPLEMSQIHGANGSVIYGSVFSMNCIGVVLFTPLVTKLAKGMKEPVKTFTGIMLILAGLGIFLGCKGFVPAYYISMLVFTLGEVFSVLADNPFLTRRVPAGHRGRVYGINSVAQTVFSGASQLVIGQVFDRAGSFAAWSGVYIIGALSLAAAIVLIRMDRKVYPKLYLN